MAALPGIAAALEPQSQPAGGSWVALVVHSGEEGDADAGAPGGDIIHRAWFTWRHDAPLEPLEESRHLELTRKAGTDVIKVPVWSFGLTPLGPDEWRLDYWFAAPLGMWMGPRAGDRVQSMGLTYVARGTTRTCAPGTARRTCPTTTGMASCGWNATCATSAGGSDWGGRPTTSTSRSASSTHARRATSRSRCSRRTPPSVAEGQVGRCRRERRLLSPSPCQGPRCMILVDWWSLGTPRGSSTVLPSHPAPPSGSLASGRETGTCTSDVRADQTNRARLDV